MMISYTCSFNIADALVPVLDTAATARNAYAEHHHTQNVEEQWRKILPGMSQTRMQMPAISLLSDYVQIFHGETNFWQNKNTTQGYMSSTLMGSLSIGEADNSMMFAK
jgi:hypothetical protein